jgi:hypothetical protein
MSSGTIVVIIVVAVIVILAAAAIGISTRRRRLQEKFGPEYDRVAREQSSKMRADQELSDREQRIKKLNIRPLSQAQAERYATEWIAIQERFVDSPQAAVTDAYDLVLVVMKDRGYPVEDYDQVVTDLSVQHAPTLEHFRAAHDISQNAASAQTEDLRRAVINYRALFADLLDNPPALANSTTGTTTADAAAAPAATGESDVAVADQRDAAVTETPADGRPAAGQPVAATAVTTSAQQAETDDSTGTVAADDREQPVTQRPPAGEVGA